MPHSINLADIFTTISIYSIMQAFFLLLLGYVVARITSKTASQLLTKFTPLSQDKIIRRGIFYVILTLFIIAALQHLGFKLNVLLGAAGILTVALGFASQTSVSNIISGLFLIAEKPFVVGDSIKVDSISGEILSIDLLSIKIRTADNTLVRMPNEVLIKSNAINLTRFPIRRFDLQIGVAYKEDLDRIKNILTDLADHNPLCLEEPKPAIYILGFGESAINLQFSVWTSKSNFTELKNSIQEQVKKAFEINQIEIPYPQISLSTASITEAFPINLLKEKS